MCSVQRSVLVVITALHRLSSHALPPYPSPPPTFCRCVGTITQYCAASDEHLVVFDETFLQPKWVTVSADSLDVILGQDETDITRTYNTALHCTALYCIALYCNVLHCTALYSILIQHCAVLIVFFIILLL